MTDPPIRVLIVDDHQMFCEALQEAFKNCDHVEVVGLANDGRAAVQAARRLKPDIAVLDIVMPELNGIEAARQIPLVSPATKMIALSMHADRRYITAMLEAGVSGYLMKDCGFEEFGWAIRAVAAGQVYLSPAIARAVVEGYRKAGDLPAPPASPLSAREREVLQLLSEGCRMPDIAEHLHLSVKTVESHRRQIMRKLEINTLAGLTKYAIREGLTSL